MSTKPSVSKESKAATSDESNSTEHDVTVSLSGTDEMNDTHSVFSDSVSLVSKASKINDAKKVLHKMNKLKEENILLKEALDKANASDITMLKSKLRGCNADLVRLRQNNLELKDRIQVLEGRLFSALSAQTTRSSGNTSSDLSAVLTTPPEQLSTQSDSKFTSSERAQLMDTIKSLQSRCKHLSRLVQSYETKMSQLEAGDGGHLLKQATEAQQSTKLEFHIIENEHSEEASVGKETADPPSEASIPLKSALKGSTGKPYVSHVEKRAAEQRRVQLQLSDADARVQQARAEDAKMIRELSEEVRRLVALVPRAAIEATEGTQAATATTATAAATTSISFSGSNEAEKEDADDDEGGEFDERGVSSKREANDKRRPLGEYYGIQQDSKAAAGGYSPEQLLCSFFAGVLVMLLCVAFSGYSVYAAASASAGASLGGKSGS